MAKSAYKVQRMAFVALISCFAFNKVFAFECDSHTNPNCGHIYGNSVNNTSQQLHDTKGMITNEKCFYRCNSSQITSNEDKCVSRDQICDITPDCDRGDDEHQSCDQLPNGAYCLFGANDNCSWHNLNQDQDSSYWATESDPIKPNEWFLSVQYRNNKHSFGKMTLIRSASFPPLHPDTWDTNSLYFNTCRIRFWYLFSWPSSELMLELYESNSKSHNLGQRLELWRKFLKTNEGKTGSVSWTRVSLVLPKIEYEYRLVFTWSQTYRGVGSTRNKHVVHLDNISLSKECFGIGMPLPPVRPTPDPIMASYFDIPNNTTLKNYRLTPCGSYGRSGPTYEQCEQFYSKTDTRAAVMDSSTMIVNGTQMWTVPRTAYYTIFGRGAKGGHGLHSNSSGGNGALVRSVYKFQEGDTIFTIIGQPGIDACGRSDLMPNLKSKCLAKMNRLGKIGSIRKEIENVDKNLGGAGGGGGGTYVFKIEDQNLVPLLIAGGGGGGGSSDGDWHLIEGKHGRGFENLLNTKGSFGNGDESGGGWFADPLVDRPTSGSSLLSGAKGGYVCNKTHDWATDGGFGGGGGGCISGGGGGGYQGGDSFEGGRGGQGGTSYARKGSSYLSLSTVRDDRKKDNQSDGVVVIYPQIENCCNDGLYPCVVTGQSASGQLTTHCVCSHNTFELFECTRHPSSIVIIILSSILVFVVLLSIFCAIAVVRYRKSCNSDSRSGGDRSGRDASASQLLPSSSTDVQLSRLRHGHIITEYNPNYEFGGSTCTLQDLREVPREKLTLIKALGQGAFGEVYQGFLHNMPGEITDELPVAVKTLPEYSANNQAEMDFLMEALIMSKFKHRNIVRFIGVCFEKMPRFIVLELLPGGDLKTFLRESRATAIKPSPLVMGDILVIALDIALGCQYLEENHFIHRDIAARNCLLSSKTKSQMSSNINSMNQMFNICNYHNGFNNSGIIVKIADFGMARDIYRADYYRKGGKAMLPVKWMPPEAFLDGIFTSKTDVWSFGVLLWEVMSMGYMPYPGRGNQEVMQMVTAGGRLEAPNSSCPSQVYAIMTQCWNPAPDGRPSFATIIERLGYCLQDPDVLNVKLPIFQRAPSMERDMTLMRPPPDATDYLVPNNPCSNSNSNYSMSTEKTELLSPDTCSTFSCSNEDNKLLELLDDVNPPVVPPRTGNWRETSFSDRNQTQTQTQKQNPIDSSTARSNGIKSDIMANNPSAQPLILDATTLLQQPSRYVNVSVSDTSDNLNSNNVRPNGQQINC